VDRQVRVGQPGVGADVDEASIRERATVGLDPDTTKPERARLGEQLG
jgi:hypothetical protein